MEVELNNNEKLTNEQRSYIAYKLKKGKKPHEIIESWKPEIHQRSAPSLQTIYKIRRQLKKSNGICAKKSGPKKRHVLTEMKLEEIVKVIQENKYITIRNLSELVGLSKTTTENALKILKYKHFNARMEKFLTEGQKNQRVKFCTTFLKWNDNCKRMVWWSDESLFSVDNVNKHQKANYIALENEFEKLEKKLSRKTVTVWAGIRGDGKVIYRILRGNQSSEDYIQLLLNVFPEMESRKSFLMQDGASIHTSNDAIDWIEFLFKNRWIGLGSQRLEFPPYSYDLTPLDFSFWSYLKRKVAVWEVDTLDELVEVIDLEMKNIPESVVINMCKEVSERCKKCIKCHGDRF